LADVGLTIIPPLGADREGDSVTAPPTAQEFPAKSAISWAARDFDSNLNCFFIGHSTGLGVLCPA
jgi:hypothetical protein